MNRAAAVWIYLPVAASATAAGALAGLLGVGGNSEAVSAWSHVATILAVFVLGIFGLGVLAASAAGAYGIGRLIGILPYYSVRARGIVALVLLRIRDAADWAAEPVLWAASLSAAARGVVDFIRETGGRPGRSERGTR